MRHSTGFTLLELMVVLLVIGILSAIAIPRFLGQKERAYIITMKSDLRNLVTAEEAYVSSGNGYSTNQAALNFVTSAGVTITILSADSSGWSATAAHNGTTKTCGIYMGSATSPVGGAPAGQATCP